MSLFAQITPDKISTHPFPHFTAESVLDQSLTQELIHDFPPLESFTRGRTYPDCSKIQATAVSMLANPSLSSTWKNFLREHLTQESFEERMRVWAPHALREFPDLEQRFGPLSQWRAGIRDQDDYSTCDVLLDAQISVHTPIVGEPAWDRGPHIKNRDKLFASLLFLRPDHDRSLGADWEAYSIRPTSQPLFDPHRQTTEHKYLKLEKAFPYRNNTMVGVLNTPRSIQGWSLRTPSEVPFLYVAFIAQMPQKLFTLAHATSPQPPARRGFARRLLNRFSGKKSALVSGIK